MKYLKKVSASQLISNTGTIIDSMNPGDDQTVNAPSIHAVKDYVENYSMTEQRIGTWLGKPLYRKVVRYQGTFAIGNNTVPHGISNLERIIDIKISQYPRGDEQGQYHIPYIGSNSKALNLNETNKTNLYFMAQEAWVSNYVWDFIIEYTKTTD